MIDSFTCGPWYVEYRLGDGGRLSRMTYKGYDLLTGEPADFRPPSADLGQYERRPVYGYDDCFPSVGSCYFPGTQLYIPDHGEVCWLGWDLEKETGSLSFAVRSKIVPLAFGRKMVFTESRLMWLFEVRNEGPDPVPFQHSMHPLLRVDEIVRMELPDFASAYDWNRGHLMDNTNPETVRKLLLSGGEGSVEMLFLRNIKTGELSWTYFNGMQFKMSFPANLFPTLGIWWNKRGYPDEDGIPRGECAFEPTAGNTSVLSQAFADGECLSVGPGRRLAWQVCWEVASGE